MLFFLQMMNSNGNNHRGSMSPSSNPVAAVAGVGQGAPTGGLHMAAAQAAAAAAAGGPPVAVQAVQTVQATAVQAATAAGMGGGGGLAGVGGINNDGGLSSSFNPANPLAGVYSPKTSHLSIAVQQQLEQAEQAVQAAVVYQQQQPQIMASAASAAAPTPVSAVAAEAAAAADINELPLPPGWSVDYTMRGTYILHTVISRIFKATCSISVSVT